MDYESSSKFISSLAKFLQSLCNGYVEFDSGVQVIGHLYLSVDTGKTIDYILNEKVCKTDENSVTFISNSFHAQPAEKPKPPSKRAAKDLDKADLKNEEESDNYITGQAEPRSTNVGTMPASKIINQNSPHSQSAKRPYSPSHKQSASKSGHASPKHKKNRTELLEQNTVSNPASENSISSAPSPAADGSSHAISAQSSDAHGSQLNESYQHSFFHPDEENSVADESEERDIKPSIDTDVTFIKEEFAPPSSCSQSGAQGRDRTHGDDSSLYPYQSNQVFPGSYTSQSGFGASQRSNFSSSGTSHMYSSSSGQGSSQMEGDNSGDPSDLFQGTTRSQADVKPHKTRKMVMPRKTPVSIQHVPEDDEDVNSNVEEHVLEQDGFKEERMTDDESPAPDSPWPGGIHDPSNSIGVFECLKCGKAYSYKRCLEKHMSEVHHTLQPDASGMFECQKCGKSYTLKRCLQRHLWQCNQMRRLKCCVCKREFYRSDKLRNHMRQSHSLELPRKTSLKSLITFHDSLS